MPLKTYQLFVLDEERSGEADGLPMEFYDRLYGAGYGVYGSTECCRGLPRSLLVEPPTRTDARRRYINHDPKQTELDIANAGDGLDSVVRYKPVTVFVGSDGRGGHIVK